MLVLTCPLEKDVIFQDPEGKEIGRIRILSVKPETSARIGFTFPKTINIHREGAKCLDPHNNNQPS